MSRKWDQAWQTQLYKKFDSAIWGQKFIKLLEKLA